MMIVSVVNQKGGVAKTTTCANLGACLAERGLRTLLIDLDPQANLTIGLGVEWYNLPCALHNVLLNPEETPLATVLHQIGELPLYLAPGHLNLADCEVMLMPAADRAYRLRNALEELTVEQQFDWILIDCPPSLGTLTQNAIVASSHLLIPTEPKFYAFAGMDTLNKMIVSLTKGLRFKVELLGVLLTMFERGTRLHQTIAAEIRERFGEKVFDTVIYKNVRLSESEVEGKPIILFDRRATGAQNYEALAEEILVRAGYP
ncbi:MAG TPA: ParA family protein [Chthonomonadales bacterium]|nr:ParA family protein [Chthonomonadales bacterium]